MTPRILYYVSGSIASWRVMLALHEKNLPFEARRLKVMRAQRETRTPEFLALNPRGQTPVLVEPDGVAINESLGLLSYLEFRYPEPSLLPRDAGMGPLLAWVQEAEATACVYDPMEQLFSEEPLSMEQKAMIQNAVQQLAFELNLWENRLNNRSFLSGDCVSLADCSFYPVLAYLLRRGLQLEPYPALQAYAVRFSQRDSARASLPSGWEHPPRRNLFREALSLLKS